MALPGQTLNQREQFIVGEAVNQFKTTLLTDWRSLMPEFGQDFEVQGLWQSGATMFTPDFSRLMVAGSSIRPDTTMSQINAGSDITLTSTPTIPDGEAGQLMFIVNTGSNDITFQDESVLASSNLFLSKRRNARLEPNEFLPLVFDFDIGRWIGIHLGTPDELCYDRVVDASGGGTDLTIQDAIDALDLGTPYRPWMIKVVFQEDAAYTENLVFDSTERYALHGCSGVMSTAFSIGEFGGGQNSSHAGAVRIDGTVTTTGAGTGEIGLRGLHFDGSGSITIDVSRVSLKIDRCFVASGSSEALQLGTTTACEINNSQIGSDNTKKAVDLGLAAGLVASNTYFEGWLDLSAQVGARFDHCVVDVNNSGAGTAAVVCDEGLDKSSWRFVDCYIQQRNASGHGFRINSGASEHNLSVIGDCTIRGAGGGTAVRFVHSATATDEGAAVCGNIIDNWSTGIDAGSAENIITGCNTYINVTTNTTGGGGTGTILFDGTHGSLAELSDDDHSIYLLLAGRSGGQTAIGGTASGEDLTLQSTAHATRGNVIISDPVHIGPDGTPGSMNQLAIRRDVTDPASVTGYNIDTLSQATFTANNSTNHSWNRQGVVYILSGGAVLSGSETASVTLATLAGDGTVAELTAWVSAMNVIQTGSLTLTLGRAIRITNILAQFGATIDTAVGIEIDDLTSATVNIGLRNASPTRLVGAVTIGSDAAAAGGIELDLVGDQNISGTLNVDTIAEFTGSAGVTIANDLHLADNVKAIFGTGNDAEIYYDGNDLIIDPDAVGSGELKLLGEMDIVHTATENDGHTLEIDTNAAGFDDIKSVDIVYVTGTLAPGQNDEAVLVDLDENAASGGRFSAFEILTTTTGGVKVEALFAGAGVAPVEQLSGVFIDPDRAEVEGVDKLADLVNPLTNVNIFEADTDVMIIGNADKFEELEYILSTGSSGAGIKPKFEFSSGAGPAWTEFGPTDGTNGMRNTGIIVWEDTDISDLGVWTQIGGNYLIRITRQRASLTTEPVCSFLQLAVTVEYSWSKEGNLSINDLAVGGDSDFSGYVGLRSNNELRFYDNGNYVGFEAPALVANQIWVLPTADGAASTFLQTDGAGTLSWGTVDDQDIVTTGMQQTIVLTAGGGKESTTLPCAAPTVVEAGTNDVDYWVLDFATGADEYAFWGPIPMPDNWDGDEITAVFYWTAASGSGTVEWNIQYLSRAEGEAIDAAWTATTSVTDTLTTAGDVHITSATSAVAAGGAGGELLFIRVHRDVSGDNLGVDARLIAVKLEYTVSALSS
ncbi:hypothetical protein LCGC14_0310750 [marine sediment metagenome]|uniref:Uncharacterized protein n=1 Tax=marine sediment metagenome TaxID=412755 RepID=A0A0F9U4T0_9ZZZZ